MTACNFSYLTLERLFHTSDSTAHRSTAISFCVVQLAYRQTLSTSLSNLPSIDSIFLFAGTLPAMTTLGADGKASVRLDTLPHDVLLPIFTAVIALEDSHRSVAALRLTCKALYDPATDVLLGRQVLNSSNDSLEEQTRLIQYCHTVFFWLEVRLEPFLDPEAMVRTSWSTWSA